MSVFLKVMLVVDIVLFLAVIILPLIRFKRAIDKVNEEPVKVPVAQPAPAVVEEPVAEPVVEAPAPAVEEVAPAVVEEPVAEPEVPEMVIGDVSDKAERRVPFNEKMLFAEKKIQGYYNAIYNKFISFRKVNPRVSSKGISYRLGRDLIAKLTLRGKTLRFHLALPMDAVESNIYFQRDFSTAKAYAEVPFTVKVKSDRGLKNALKLIDVLAEHAKIEKKTRFVEIDSIELLKPNNKK